jgi:hypothetical protein
MSSILKHVIHPQACHPSSSMSSILKHVILLNCRISHVYRKKNRPSIARLASFTVKKAFAHQRSSASGEINSGEELGEAVRLFY